MTRQTATKSSERRRGSHLSDAPAAALALTDRAAGISPGRERPLLLGHRGARPVSRVGLGAGGAHVPPENTLPCFEYALANGCDGFEFDVRITRDERPVICHNARLHGCNVAASSFERLSSRSGTQLACLEDVLQAFGDRAYLDIEVKVAGAEELMVRAIRHCRPPDGYLVSSFLPEVLCRLHELDPALPLGYLCDRSRNISLWRRLPIEVFLPHHKLITQTMVDQVHERELRVFTWTVNSATELRRLDEWGVDGLISDDPKLLSEIFRGTGIRRASQGRQRQS